jgi:hypothetical protein
MNALTLVQGEPTQAHKPSPLDAGYRQLHDPPEGQSDGEQSTVSNCASWPGGHTKCEVAHTSHGTSGARYRRTLRSSPTGSSGVDQGVPEAVDVRRERCCALHCPTSFLGAMPVAPRNLGILNAQWYENACEPVFPGPT